MCIILLLNIKWCFKVALICISLLISISPRVSLFPVWELFEWFITFYNTLKVQEIISPIFSWSCHICFFVSLIFTQMDTYVNKHCNYMIHVMLFNFFWHVRFTENLQEQDKKFPYILPPANFPFYHICIFCVCVSVCVYSPPWTVWE